MDEHTELLEIARRIAADAGAALQRHRAEWSVVEAEYGREVKIDADKQAEALILAALDRAASFPVISEEIGWVGAEEARSGYVWAVDPLDGSVNYLRGYPHCAVSIALLDRGEPILGVVECFVLGESFTGLVGGGAWLNGTPISVSRIADPAAGILQTGVPARASAESFALVQERLRSWRKICMIGSAASALAYVAAGRAEAYRESGSMIWDVAAGCALVKAAGGEFRMTGPSLDCPLEVAAGNGGMPLPT